MDDDESFEWDGETDKYTYSYRQLREQGEGLMADTDDIGGSILPSVNSSIASGSSYYGTYAGGGGDGGGEGGGGDSATSYYYSSSSSTSSTEATQSTQTMVDTM